MAADTTLTIYGTGHLAGVTVAVVVAGIYMGTAVVATDGSVTVTYGSDVSGKVTAAYLATNFATAEGSVQDTTFQVFNGTTYVTVTVPVLVGLPFTATGRLLRPVTAEATDSDNGPALGKMRRANAVAMLLPEAHEDLSIGMSTSDLAAAALSTDGLGTLELLNADDAPFAGVLYQFIKDSPGFDTQFTWRSAQPYRLNVALVSLFHVVGQR